MSCYQCGVDHSFNAANYKLFEDNSGHRYATELHEVDVDIDAVWYCPTLQSTEFVSHGEVFIPTYWWHIFGFKYYI